MANDVFLNSLLQGFISGMQGYQGMKMNLQQQERDYRQQALENWMKQQEYNRQIAQDKATADWRQEIVNRWNLDRLQRARAAEAAAERAAVDDARLAVRQLGSSMPGVDIQKRPEFARAYPGFTGQYRSPYDIEQEKAMATAARLLIAQIRARNAQLEDAFNDQAFHDIYSDEQKQAYYREYAENEKKLVELGALSPEAMKFKPMQPGQSADMPEVYGINRPPMNPNQAAGLLNVWGTMIDKGYDPAITGGVESQLIRGGILPNAPAPVPMQIQTPAPQQTYGMPAPSGIQIPRNPPSYASTTNQAKSNEFWNRPGKSTSQLAKERKEAEASTYAANRESRAATKFGWEGEDRGLEKIKAQLEIEAKRLEIDAKKRAAQQKAADDKKKNQPIYNINNTTESNGLIGSGIMSIVSGVHAKKVMGYLVRKGVAEYNANNATYKPKPGKELEFKREIKKLNDQYINKNIPQFSPRKKTELRKTFAQFITKMKRKPTKAEWLSALGGKYNKFRLEELYDQMTGGR